MKKRLIALLLCGFLLAGCQKADEPAPLIFQDPVFPASTQEESFQDRNQRRQENSADPKLVSGLQGFSAQLASRVLSGSEKNTCFSPMSLSMAMSLMASGAQGETKDQLFQVLGVDGQDSVWLADQNARLFRYLWQDQEDAVLKIANSVWVDESASLKPEFASLVAEQFYASTREVDYSNTQEVSQQMSQWIGEHTGDLLHPQINLSPEQQLTLINTLYFNTQWKNVVFLPRNTQEGTFTTNLGEEKQVSYMRTVLPYGGLSTDDYTKIALDLEDGSTMLVILPKEGVSIDDLLETPTQIESLFAVDEEYPLYLDLKLPKFSFGTELEPVEALQSMGVTLAFNGGDFSDMLENAGSFSTIQHGTHFSIDEYGVQAAAYTVAPMTGGGSMEEPMEITVNRPFLFAVVAENQIPLFAGVVNDPTLA